MRTDGRAALIFHLYNSVEIVLTILTDPRGDSRIIKCHKDIYPFTFSQVSFLFQQVTQFIIQLF